jgi:transcriptional regulator with XRE-family HTH domain
MKKPGEKSSKSESGWVEGSVQDFLGLSDADMLIIETRLAAGRLLKATRQQNKLTQQKTAERLRTSQSRLAKMEAGDSSVSLDHLLRSLFALGVSRKSVAAIFTAGVRDFRVSPEKSISAPIAGARERIRLGKAHRVSSR